MFGFIDNIDFGELDAMKYYAPSSAWSVEKKRENARSKIFSGDWYGAEKKDGYFAKFVKDEDDNLILYTRTRGVDGQYANKIEWVPHLIPFFENVPRGTCLLGEVYLPDFPGSRNITSIMGCLQDKAVERQNISGKLHFYIFDVLAWNGNSMINSAAKARFNKVHTFLISDDEKYVEKAQYMVGKDLWNLLQDTLANDGEGIVITHKDGIYEPGKRPSKTTLKIKKELKQTIDCFFTGRGSQPTREYTGKEVKNWQFWENLQTGQKICGPMYKEYHLGASLIPVTKGYFYGWCGSLEIGVLRKSKGHNCVIEGKTYHDMIVYPFGWLSGLPDELKANPSEYAYRPLEVTSMEFDTLNESLRHGKMVGWRKDLSVEDCTYEKLMGE